jgi:tRNA modification GTPase
MEELLADMLVALDFPEEDVAELRYDDIERRVTQINDEVAVLRDSFQTGRLIRDGLRVAITGKPNVGKSSLLNALLGESRAIVAETPGTTRDVIEEGLQIRGISVRLMDTAGIRFTEDPVETIGVGKSKEAFDRSDLVLLVLDAAAPLDDEDRAILRRVGAKPVLAVMNKSDLPRRMEEADLQALLPGRAILRASMKTGAGLEALRDAVADMVCGGKARRRDGLLVTNLRHAALLDEAASDLREGIESVRRKEPLECVEMNLRHGWELLGNITGEQVGADILDAVFSRFCIGK